MGKFNTNAILEYLTESNLWKTSDELIYEVSPGDIIVVPKGFITDLASVPWPASMVIPKSGRYNMPAIIHDWGYFMSRIKYLLDSETYTKAGIRELVPIVKKVNLETFKFRPRSEVDSIFLGSMAEVNIPFFKRHTMHKAVRLGAWLSWGKRGRIIGYDKKKGIMRLV